jgi:hypothetical protein
MRWGYLSAGLGKFPWTILWTGVMILLVLYYFVQRQLFSASVRLMSLILGVSSLDFSSTGGSALPFQTANSF